MTFLPSPPSGLPAISPSRGEIGWTAASPVTATFAILDTIDDKMISPLEGEMAGRPEGGALGNPSWEV
jgi:peptide/nickel transport system ATP-binding protein